MKIIELDDNQQEEYCSNQKHRDRYAAFKIQGGASCHYCGNEIYMCHDCLYNTAYRIAVVLKDIGVGKK